MAAEIKEPVKMTASQLKIKVTNLEDKLEKLKNGAWCYLCDKHKSRDNFYMTTDPMSKSGLTPICKDCARKIALKIDKKGIEHEPDKDSVRLALRYLNKPFLESVWDSSIEEVQNQSAHCRTTSGRQRSYGSRLEMACRSC